MRVLVTTACLCCGLSWAALASSASPLRLVQTIPLTGVEGRIDHMALDEAGQRLFLVALGNNTVEVLDLRGGRRTRTLSGFREPQGVGFAGSPGRLFVASGGDGSVTVLDADSCNVLRTVPLGSDADNVRVDGPSRHVYVGYGAGGMATLDAATGEVLQRIALPAHPEAFHLEGAGPRIFVNLPDAGEIAVVDRERGEVTAHWHLGEARGNFPMTLDDAGGRLFIGCRRPARVVVMNANAGTQDAQLPIDGDVDDLFYDAQTQRLLASCGAGFIDVIEAPAGGVLRTLDRIRTAPGARTSLFDAASRRLFVAVPRQESRAAEVRIFAVAR